MEVEDRVEDQVEDQAVGQVEDQEIWKDIEGYEGEYQVSTHGRVKSLDRPVLLPNGIINNVKGRVISPFFDKYGYNRAFLWNHGKSKRFQVARLVALAFLPRVEGKLTVDHIDRVKSNNNISNLRWADRFDQNRNRDCVINKKVYTICFDKRKKKKPWYLRQQPKGIIRYFDTHDEAVAFGLEKFGK
jgi:hypothetical protein